jgi:hypothetical protein
MVKKISFIILSIIASALLYGVIIHYSIEEGKDMGRKLKEELKYPIIIIQK